VPLNDWFEDVFTRAAGRHEYQKNHGSRQDSTHLSLSLLLRKTPPASTPSHRISDEYGFLAVRADLSSTNWLVIGCIESFARAEVQRERLSTR